MQSGQKISIFSSSNQILHILQFICTDTRVVHTWITLITQLMCLTHTRTRMWRLNTILRTSITIPYTLISGNKKESARTRVVVGDVVVGRVGLVGEGGGVLVGLIAVLHEDHEQDDDRDLHAEHEHAEAQLREQRVAEQRHLRCYVDHCCLRLRLWLLPTASITGSACSYRVKFKKNHRSRLLCLLYCVFGASELINKTNLISNQRLVR